MSAGAAGASLSAEKKAFSLQHEDVAELQPAIAEYLEQIGPLRGLHTTVFDYHTWHQHHERNGYGKFVPVFATPAPSSPGFSPSGPTSSTRPVEVGRNEGTGEKNSKAADELERDPASPSSHARKRQKVDDSGRSPLPSRGGSSEFAGNRDANNYPTRGTTTKENCNKLVFFFDDNIDFEPGRCGAPQSRGCANLRDVRTGEFVNFSQFERVDFATIFKATKYRNFLAVGDASRNYGFTQRIEHIDPEILFSEVRFSVSRQKRQVTGTVLVKVSILDAVSDPFFFIRIIAFFKEGLYHKVLFSFTSNKEEVEASQLKTRKPEHILGLQDEKEATTNKHRSRENNTGHDDQRGSGTTSSGDSMKQSSDGAGGGKKLEPLHQNNEHVGSKPGGAVENESRSSGGRAVKRTEEKTHGKHQEQDGKFSSLEPQLQQEPSSNKHLHQSSKMPPPPHPPRFERTSSRSVSREHRSLSREHRSLSRDRKPSLEDAVTSLAALDAVDGPLSPRLTGVVVDHTSPLADPLGRGGGLSSPLYPVPQYSLQDEEDHDGDDFDALEVEQQMTTGKAKDHGNTNGQLDSSAVELLILMDINKTMMLGDSSTGKSLEHVIRECVLDATVLENAWDPSKQESFFNISRPGNSSAPTGATLMPGESASGAAVLPPAQQHGNQHASSNMLDQQRSGSGSTPGGAQFHQGAAQSAHHSKRKREKHHHPSRMTGRRFLRRLFGNKDQIGRPEAIPRLFQELQVGHQAQQVVLNQGGAAGGLLGSAAPGDTSSTGANTNVSFNINNSLLFHAPGAHLPHPSQRFSSGRSNHTDSPASGISTPTDTHGTGKNASGVVPGLFFGSESLSEHVSRIEESVRKSPRVTAADFVDPPDDVGDLFVLDSNAADTGGLPPPSGAQVVDLRTPTAAVASSSATGGGRGAEQSAPPAELVSGRDKSLDGITTTTSTTSTTTTRVDRFDDEKIVTEDKLSLSFGEGDFSRNKTPLQEPQYPGGAAQHQSAQAGTTTNLVLKHQMSTSTSRKHKSVITTTLLTATTSTSSIAAVGDAESSTTTGENKNAGKITPALSSAGPGATSTAALVEQPPPLELSSLKGHHLQGHQLSSLPAAQQHLLPPPVDSHPKIWFGASRQVFEQEELENIVQKFVTLSNNEMIVDAWRNLVHHVQDYHLLMLYTFGPDAPAVLDATLGADMPDFDLDAAAGEGEQHDARTGFQELAGIMEDGDDQDKDAASARSLSRMFESFGASGSAPLAPAA
ncbi:unnamed protein product [Amoebophrya sp. A120]|nr:unnamed protein product [Amoebophrya sp. A120]|eukprot:GSA120T00010704001.1